MISGRGRGVVNCSDYITTINSIDFLLSIWLKTDHDGETGQFTDGGNYENVDDDTSQI